MPHHPQQGYNQMVPEFRDLPEWEQVSLRERAVSDAQEYMKSYYLENGGTPIPAGYQVPERIADLHADRLVDERAAETGKAYSEQQITAYTETFKLECARGYPISEN